MNPFSLHLDGADCPKNWLEMRRVSARLDFVNHTDRDEVAVWTTSDDGHTVVYLEPSELDRLYDWLVEYRKARV